MLVTIKHLAGKDNVLADALSRAVSWWLAAFWYFPAIHDQGVGVLRAPRVAPKSSLL